MNHNSHAELTEADRASRNSKVVRVTETTAHHFASYPPLPALAGFVAGNYPRLPAFSAFSSAALAQCPLPNLLCELPPLLVAKDEPHGDKLIGSVAVGIDGKDAVSP